MIRNPSEKSLIEILQERVDTCIDCQKVGEEKVKHHQKEPNETVYRDRKGDYYRIFNDYVETRVKEGQPIAILAADESGENAAVSHPHPELPHLSGLYVREPYRSEGIASELVHEFMRTTSYDRCVADCLDQVKPFYEQLDLEVIYLEQFKSM